MNTSINRDFDKREHVKDLCRRAATLAEVGMDVWYVRRDLSENEPDDVKQAIDIAYHEALAEKHHGLWGRICNWFGQIRQFKEL